MRSGFEFIIEKNEILFFFFLRKKKRNNKNIQRKQKTSPHSSLLTFVNIEENGKYSYFRGCAACDPVTQMVTNLSKVGSGAAALPRKISRVFFFSLK